MADPRTKKGKADVSLDRMASSWLLVFDAGSSSGVHSASPLLVLEYRLTEQELLLIFVAESNGPVEARDTDTWCAAPYLGRVIICAGAVKASI